MPKKIKSDDFVVFEDSPTFSSSECQTDEYCTETATQTSDSAIPTKPSPEDEQLIAYWNDILSNKETEIARLKKLNEEIESEIVESKNDLEKKNDEYDQLFQKASEHLERNEDSDDSSNFNDYNDDEYSVIVHT